MFRPPLMLTCLAIALLCGCEDSKPTNTNTGNTTNTATTTARTTGEAPGDGPALDSKAGKLGPFALGMTVEQAQGLEPKLELANSMPGSTKRGKAGSYDLTFHQDDDRLAMIEYTLSGGPGLSVGEKTVAATDDIEEAARGFEGCGELEPRTGGNIIRCAHGVVLKSPGPVKTVLVSIMATGGFSPRLDPGKQLGPLKLGMSHEDAGKVGLEWKLAKEGGSIEDETVMIGSFETTFSKEKTIERVAITLDKANPEVVVGGTVINKMSKLADLQRALKGCAKPEVAIGATTLRCQGVDLLAAGPTAQITRLTLTPAKPKDDAK